MEEMRTAFNTISKEFKEENIPMNTIRMVVKDFKIQKKIKGIEHFCMEYNKTLVKFVDVCQKVAERSLIGKVHIKTINGFIDIIVKEIK